MPQYTWKAIDGHTAATTVWAAASAIRVTIHIILLCIAYEKWLQFATGGKIEVSLFRTTDEYFVMSNVSQ